MSNTISLTAAKRETIGTSASRRLRAQGIIPAVIYSANQENVNLQLTLDQVLKVEHHAGLVSLNIQGIGVKSAIVKEVQRKAINDALLSVDFQEVKAGEKVNVVVPVEPKGEPDGLRAGGQLEQVIHELELQVSPAEIPEVILVDVSALQLDQEITVADLPLPGDAKVIGDTDQIVFQVRMPHVKLEEPEAAPAEEAAPADAKESK